MISISVSDLSYKIGEKVILDSVSFSLDAGDRLGIVGVNGAGKSTLLGMITSRLTPTEGSVYIAKNYRVGVLEQNSLSDSALFADGGEETVLDRMYDAFGELRSIEARLAVLQEKLDTASGAELESAASEFSSLNARFTEGGGLYYKSKCKSILIHLGFPESMHSQPISSLSGGERTRLLLAQLLASEPELLILDEPTNHLDTDTMAWLEEHLSSYPKTVIVVSHDRFFLDRVTNKTLDIENRRATLYKCPYSAFAEQKKQDYRAKMKKYELQQKEIARQEAIIEQQRRFNREKNFIKAESRMKALERMEKVERPDDAPKGIGFSFRAGIESGNDVLSVKELSMGFGQNTLFSGISFDVKKHERVFILGPNGCGKSTLVKILCGLMRQKSGRVDFGYNVELGYYDQENQNLTDTKTVLDELWDAYPTMAERDIRSVLAQFLFRAEDVSKSVSVLSGGERARLTLAKLMFRKMNLLILDEPTNHLDISSREALEDALAGYDGTLIAVSHDRYFIDKLATRIITISPDGAVDFRGTYREYEQKKRAAAEGAAEVPAAAKEIISSAKDEYLERKKNAAEERKYRKHVENVRAEIAALEKELVEISDELFGEAAYDYMRAAELEDRRITAEDRLMQLYEEEETFDI